MRVMSAVHTPKIESSIKTACSKLTSFTHVEFIFDLTKTNHLLHVPVISK